MNDFTVFRATQVSELLDYRGCIESMRRAMAGLSKDTREQPLRTIYTVREGQFFGLMPGMAAVGDGFGAKLLSVFHDPAKGGRSKHKGIVALFEESAGSLVCIADAHEVTKIRTACASAMATDVLARKEASTLAVYGCGAQAESHIRAIPLVRPIRKICVWGRNADIARDFAGDMAAESDCEVVAAVDAREAAEAADIICTVTGAAEPILNRDWVKPGTHINAVGSSYAGPVEIDPRLVADSAYFVEYRPSAEAAAAELIRARELGLVGDDAIRAEIGEVLNGTAQGRINETEITLYKSLGHIVQDLAAARYMLDRAGA